MNEKIRAFLGQCIADRIFPGCVVGTIDSGGTDCIAAGRLTYNHDSPPVTQDTVYDVASITKAIPTSCLALQLLEQGILAIDSLLVDYIPECNGRFLDQVRLFHLLTHTLDFDFRLSEKKGLLPSQILSSIFSADLKYAPGSSFCYANATSILLGLVVERAAGKRLDLLAQERFFSSLAMTSTTFFPEMLDRDRVAPTEIDAWRGRTVRAEVHDESAWALRPAIIAGSAGLFSTAPDLLRFMFMLLKGGERDNRRYFTKDTVRLMHRNALHPRLGAVTALGWELDQERFMGRNRTTSTFGKTGFTGCTVIMDPAQHRGFALLANHTWPRRRQDRDLINTVRSAMAEMLFS